MGFFRLTIFSALAALVFAPALAADVRFHLQDRMDPSEVSESTSIYIDGVRVAHFVLDGAHLMGAAEVTLPAAPSYDYALCGRITIRTKEGATETHVLDSGATLKELDSHAFEAFATENFTSFYLSDLASQDVGPPPDLHHTQACEIPDS